MGPESPIFELRSVSQRFGALTALTDVSLTIFEGERIALVGSSGAGKSTLLRLLNGTLLPSEGEVTALGYALGKLSTHQVRRVQRQIGTIYQQFHLVDSLSVIHNVNAGHLGRWSFLKAMVSLIYPQDIDTALQALQRVGIPDKIYTRTDQLSGGQQQRVAIARVLVQNPLAILADEPVASLDPERSREVMQLLSELVQAEQKTLVVSLHSVELALEFCDRIIGLRQGAVVFDELSSRVSPAMLTDLYQLPEPCPADVERYPALDS
jgi:phosphonate transport system ATP-binding protein